MPEPTKEDYTRELFERWMTNDGKWPKAVEKNKSGDYVLMQTASHWVAFRAGFGAREWYNFISSGNPIP